MRWTDRLRLLRWRALEEADSDAELLPSELRREATRSAHAPSTELSAERSDAWLLRRCSWLEKQGLARAQSVLASMVTAVPPGWCAWLWCGGALLLGTQLSVLGQHRDLNVLALPLLGLLLWNAVVMLLSLVIELRGAGAALPVPGQSALMRWVERIAARTDHAMTEAGHEALATRRAAEGAAASRAVAFFRRDSAELAGHRLAGQLRAGLHLGAALLAVGCVGAMYARGWSREYLALWESTLLDAPGAERFLGTLFAPAAWLTGVAVPLERVAAMQDSVAHAPVPMLALRWIHLYAGTLAVFVILPRLGLATLTLLRTRRLVAEAWRKLDVAGYAARLHRAVQGVGELALVLTHGWRDEPRDRWAHAIRERLGGQVGLEYGTVPSGEEDDFAAQWQSPLPTVLLVFNAAAIPEAEVHGALARALRTRLSQQHSGSRLVALLDASALRERRDEAAVRTRVDLWRGFLSAADEVLVC